MEPVASTEGPSPTELAETGRAIISLRNIEKSFQQGVTRANEFTMNVNIVRPKSEKG